MVTVTRLPTLEPSLIDDDGVKLSFVAGEGIANHSPECHLVGEPCIGLYEGVNEGNIIPVLVHETLHCVLYELGLRSGDPDDRDTPSDAVVDELWPTVLRTQIGLSLPRGDVDPWELLSGEPR